MAEIPTVRTQCCTCNSFFDATSGYFRDHRSRPVCQLCRDNVVKLFEEMRPCCREAYCRGRISSARDHNDMDMVRTLGEMLDKMREDANV